MNVVLLGAKGMLGRAVAQAAPAGVAVQEFDLPELDITDASAVQRALSHGPAWVINCAAYTRVDDAEDHEAKATRVNGEAVGIIAHSAAAAGARVLHISTDYVFDGLLGRPYREDDATNPLGAYGRGKLKGERALAASDCQWTMVRTQWLYGGGPSFVRTMWTRARAGLASRVVNDQFGSPTHTGELAQAIWRLVGERAEGVWHVAAGGHTNWYEVARLVYAQVGADPALVTPCTTPEYNAKAPRPADGRLDTTKFGKLRAYDAVLTEALHPERVGVEGP